MITVTRTYEIKAEFKLLYQLLRYMSHQECYKTSPTHLESDMTTAIDAFRMRWGYIGIPKDTISKLYRFAISYRYHIIWKLNEVDFGTILK